MLRRNRDFVLLQSGQLLSSAGSQSTAIAYPLLVLALTGSAAKAGVVAFARVAPFAVFGLVAGAVADRYDRRTVMVCADLVRAVAVGGLALALIVGDVAFWAVPAVAFVEGAGSAFFGPAAAGALRSVVPAAQLTDAAGVQQGRLALVGVFGPPLGGVLFGLGRAVPFVADACSYMCSVVSLVLMRTPFQEARVRSRVSVREGWRFLWGEPFLRVTTLLYGLSNFIGPGVLLVVVVAGDAQGLGPGAIGLLLAAFGAFVFAGSLLSRAARRAVPPRAILVAEGWAWLGMALFVAWPDVYVLVASILPCAMVLPITDAVVIGHRLRLTPDALIGRVESVRATLALLLAPLGPLLAGVLLSATSARTTVAVFAGCALILAVWSTRSAALRIR